MINLVAPPGAVNTLKDAAIDYFDRGYYPIPIRPGGKTPDVAWRMVKRLPDARGRGMVSIASSLSDLAENPECFERSCLVCLHNKIIIAD
jgi:hypothetical protein